MAGDASAAGLVMVVAGRERTLPAGSACSIGRGREVDVVVLDPLISRRHAEVRSTPSGWQLVDLGSANGLWHDGVRVTAVAVDRPMAVRLGGPDGVLVELRPSSGRPPSGQPPTSGQNLPVQQPPVQQPPVQQPPVQQPPVQAPAYPAPIPPTPIHPMLVQRAAQLPQIHQVPVQQVPVQQVPVQQSPEPVRIGRAAGNTVILPDLLVSRRHAELVATPHGPELRDLGSDNGTYVNGRAIRSEILTAGDLIAIGPYSLRFDGVRLAVLSQPHGVEFAAAHLSVRTDTGVPLLEDVSLSLPPRTLMAVIGPSGAGKSTLLHALSGLRPATAGAVQYAGRDFYADHDELRHRIGFVPQQDILHQVLTVQQALRFGARLRFPADTSRKERSERVREVAGELSLGDRLGTRISRLSGGERKRASTAMELLTKPALLFLDEPTSGLDADLDREVMRRLRLLADDGRTVIVVTHTLDNLGQCDVVLVLAKGGHPAYLGPPAGVFGYFGVSSWADVFGLLKTRPSAEWAARFRQWPGRDARSEPPDVGPSGGPRAELTPAPRRSAVVQWATLVRRQLAVIAADRALLAILTVLPLILALIARAIPAHQGLAHRAGNPDAAQLLLVLIVGAALAGAAGSVRELVKERPLYRRERAVGLSAAAYLAAKIAVFTVIGALQGAVLTVLALAGRQPPDQSVLLGEPTVEIAVVVAVLAAVSAVFGLAVSAAVRDESQAMPLLVVLTMAQLVLCGGLIPVSGRPVLDQISWLLPSRWGFAATASTVDLRFMRGQPDGDRLWTPTAPTWLLDVGVLVALGVLAAVITAVLQSRRTREP